MNKYIIELWESDEISRAILVENEEMPSFQQLDPFIIIRHSQGLICVIASNVTAINIARFQGEATTFLKKPSANSFLKQEKNQP